MSETTDAPRQEHSYSISYHCQNCYHTFQHVIEYGTKAPREVLCPRCGVKAANKAQPQKPWDMLGRTHEMPCTQYNMTVNHTENPEQFAPDIKRLSGIGVG